MHRYVSQKKFLSTVGQGCVVWINPTAIELHYGSDSPSTEPMKSFFRKRIKSNRNRELLNRWVFNPMERFVIRPGVIPEAVRIEDLDKYKKIDDFVKHLICPRDSLWCARLLNDLSSQGFARHKKKVFLYSTNEIYQFLESYAETVVRSIDRQGFSHSFTGYEATAVIDSEGRIGKTSSGNHHF